MSNAGRGGPSNNEWQVRTMVRGRSDEPVVRLYPLTGPLYMLVMASQAGCDVECCGPEIFAIGSEASAHWVREAGLRDAREALEQLQGYIAEMEALCNSGYPGKIASVDEEFNATWAAPEWLAWFRRWKDSLAGAIGIVESERTDDR
jgi:hypothetical protein